MIHIVLPIILSFVSTVLMSYVAMAGEVADWGSSLIAVLCMLLLSHLFTKTFVDEYVIGGIAAGSMGGMIGVCIGTTWPSLYFLHKQEFEEWMHHPIFFALIVSGIVVIAGLFAFLIAKILRDYLIFEKKLKFPFSVLMYDMLDAKHRIHRIKYTMYGISGLLSYHSLVHIIKLSHVSVTYIIQAPIFISLGFISRFHIVVPMLIGVCMRFFILFIIGYYTEKVVMHEYYITVGIGMFFGIVMHLVFNYIKSINFKSYYNIRPFLNSVWKYIVLHRFKNCAVLICLGGLSMVLHVTHMKFIEQLYLLTTLLFLSRLIAILFGEMGESGIVTFVNFALLPLSYIFVGAPIKLLYIAIFGILCLGIIINLLFSDKLGNLAKISYLKIFYYQVIGFFVGMFSIGFIMWWYIHIFKLGSAYLPASDALKESVLLGHSHDNYHILLLGFFLSLVFLYLKLDVPLIVASLIMPISQIVWLVGGGVISYFVKKNDQYYPYCFGIYTGHTLYIIIRAFLSL